MEEKKRKQSKRMMATILALTMAAEPAIGYLPGNVLVYAESTESAEEAAAQTEVNGEEAGADTAQVPEQTIASETGTAEIGSQPVVSYTETVDTASSGNADILVGESYSERDKASEEESGVDEFVDSDEENNSRKDENVQEDPGSEESTDSEETLSTGTPTETEASGETEGLSENDLPENDLPKNGLSENALSENDLPKNGLSENALSDDALLENDLAEMTVDELEQLAQGRLAAGETEKQLRVTDAQPAAMAAEAVSQPVALAAAPSQPAALAAAGDTASSVPVLQNEINKALEALASLTGRVTVILNRGFTYEGDVNINAGNRAVSDDFELELAASDAGESGMKCV